MKSLLRAKINIQGHGDAQKRVVAKYVGFWPFDVNELYRWRAVGSLAPVTFGVTDGYLLYEWVDGTILESGSGEAGLGEDFGIAVAEYVAKSSARYEAGQLDGRDALVRIKRSISRLSAVGWMDDNLASDLIQRLKHEPICHRSLVQWPRNQGAWHFVRVSGQPKWRRLHLDASHWEKRVDPAQEIAAVCAELALPPHELVDICRRYSRLSGDEHVLKEAIWNSLVYVATILSEFEEHEQALAHLPSLLMREGVEEDEYTRRLDTLRSYVRIWASAGFTAESL